MQFSDSVAIRKHERAHLDVYVNKIVGDEPHLSRVRDISESGVYLYKLLEPELGQDQVGLEIMLPNADHVIWAIGKVVRSEAQRKADGVAIRFVRMSEHDRAVIRDYVEHSKTAQAA